jgi:hypothetical protein
LSAHASSPNGCRPIRLGLAVDEFPQAPPRCWCGAEIAEGRRAPMKVRAALKTIGIAFSLAIFSSMAGATNASRDWNIYPVVLQLTTNEDVFAIGDPHGDRDRLIGVLLAAGLIAATPTAPDQVKWAGGKSVLVIVGDLIDKWSESLRDAARHRRGRAALCRADRGRNTLPRARPQGRVGRRVEMAQG